MDEIKTEDWLWLNRVARRHWNNFYHSTIFPRTHVATATTLYTQMKNWNKNGNNQLKTYRGSLPLPLSISVSVLLSLSLSLVSSLVSSLSLSISFLLTFCTRPEKSILLLRVRPHELNLSLHGGLCLVSLSLSHEFVLYLIAQIIFSSCTQSSKHRLKEECASVCVWKRDR